MMYLDKPPQLVETRVLVDAGGISSPWCFLEMGGCQPWGHPVDCFIEGPSFDKSGNLYVVDIPRPHFSGFRPAAFGL